MVARMNAAVSNDDMPPATEDAAPRATLLVVEDDVLIRFAVSSALRGAGYTVLEAASADEARAVLQTIAVDLLFIDLHLHGDGGDGLSVARFARTHRPWVKLVFTSGKVRLGQEPEIAAFGPFLPKPYLFSRVLQVVENTLGGDVSAK
jgi:CheY-like chemotaxis protein